MQEGHVPQGVWPVTTTLHIRIWQQLMAGLIGVVFEQWVSTSSAQELCSFHGWTTSQYPNITSYIALCMLSPTLYGMVSLFRKPRSFQIWPSKVQHRACRLCQTPLFLKDKGQAPKPIFLFLHEQGQWTRVGGPDPIHLLQNCGSQMLMLRFKSLSVRDQHLQVSWRAQENKSARVVPLKGSVPCKKDMCPHRFQQPAGIKHLSPDTCDSP